MGFLQNFFHKVFPEQSEITPSMPAAQISSSFELLDEETVESHLRIARYSDFLLTDAVRPSYDLQVIPRQAYRHDTFRENRDKSSSTEIPVLMISASAERLFDLFLDLLTPLGEHVDVVLETSHAGPTCGSCSKQREHIDIPVLKSILCDYEEMLVNDGCLGVAVLNGNIPLEVQFDEHKLLIVYGHKLDAFEEILEEHGIECDEEVHFITEAEHVHASNEEYADAFETLKHKLGMEESFGPCH